MHGRRRIGGVRHDPLTLHQATTARRARRLTQSLRLPHFNSILIMCYQRQTRLGYRNSTKSLTLIDLSQASYYSNEPLGIPTNTTSSTTPTRSYILNLPDELLLPIVKLACTSRKPDYPSHRHDPVHDSGVVRVLSTVCKRMKRLAQPFLFKEIVFESPHTLVRPSMKVKKLHRTLKGRKDLRESCRLVELYVWFEVAFLVRRIRRHVDCVYRVL